MSAFHGISAQHHSLRYRMNVSALVLAGVSAWCSLSHDSEQQAEMTNVESVVRPHDSHAILPQLTLSQTEVDSLPVKRYWPTKISVPALTAVARPGTDIVMWAELAFAGSAGSGGASPGECRVTRTPSLSSTGLPELLAIVTSGPFVS